MPIASLESLIGRRAYLPFLEAGCVDVAIVDVLWNGVAEAVKIANLCDTFEVNCAAHNYHSHLGNAISAHFCEKSARKILWGLAGGWWRRWRCCCS